MHLHQFLGINQMFSWKCPHQTSNFLQLDTEKVPYLANLAQLSPVTGRLRCLVMKCGSCRVGFST